jgi:hypothetical protein
MINCSFPSSVKKFDLIIALWYFVPCFGMHLIKYILDPQQVAVVIHPEKPYPFELRRYKAATPLHDQSQVTLLVARGKIFNPEGMICKERLVKDTTPLLFAAGIQFHEHRVTLVGIKPGSTSGQKQTPVSILI